MDNINTTDIQSIRTMISNDITVDSLRKEEICSYLKSAKLNFSDFSSILHQIKSKYEMADRFDILRHLSIDFGDIENVEISNILESLKIFGEFIECAAFDSIVKIIESIFSKFKQPKTNHNIDVLKAVQILTGEGLMITPSNIYNIFKKIANEYDHEAISFGIKENLHKSKYGEEIIFSYSYSDKNTKLIRSMMESGLKHSYRFPDKILTQVTNIFSKSHILI